MSSSTSTRQQLILELFWPTLLQLLPAGMHSSGQAQAALVLTMQKAIQENLEHLGCTKIGNDSRINVAAWMTARDILALLG